MIYTCTIEVKEGEDFYSRKLEQMAKAAHDESMWKPKRTRADVIAETDLSNKCGSCNNFRPYHPDNPSSHGECDKGRAWGARTRPACKLYERRPTYGN